MADKNILEQMLEHLVNEDQQKAEELFHEYVVAKSREIYESLIDAELDEAADEDEDEENKKVDEASEDEEDEDNKKVDENFEDVAYEGDDEMNGPDQTDDLAGELDAGMDDEEGGDFGDKDPEELFQDLDAIVDELQAKFDSMNGGDDMGDDMEGGDEEGGNPFAKEEDFDLETVREYVEKVPGGHGAEKKGQGEGQYSGTGSQADRPNVNTKSIVAGKNDMGGTTANILNGGTESSPVEANKGQLKGSGLLKGTPKDMNTGNINVPGGKAGNAFSKKEPGHGAEKKGEGEGKYSGTGTQSDSVTVSKQSLFRGRR